MFGDHFLRLWGTHEPYFLQPNPSPDDIFDLFAEFCIANGPQSPHNAEPIWVSLQILNFVQCQLWNTEVKSCILNYNHLLYILSMCANVKKLAKLASYT